jgi:tetratricopeptide (TPR) repeat protein
MQKRFYQFVCLAFTGLALFGCATTKAAKAPVAPLRAGGCAVALAIHQGEAPLDSEIRRIQGKIKNEPYDTLPQIERLGWKFVEKARRSYDPGFYKLAEQCAQCMEEFAPTQTPDPNEKPKLDNAAAKLLRGHALHNLHQFGAAETLARELSAKRGSPYDFALLGDVLLEQGRIAEAAQAYQKLMDLKPGMQAYLRAAQLRWAQGDGTGAIEMAFQAVKASSPVEPETSAWAATRLAFYDWQMGYGKQALEACESALKVVPFYPPALLVQGRIWLAQGRASAAIPALQQAVRQNPLPEYQWALIEALHAENKFEEAKPIEAALRDKGAAEDPRTFALYLASQKRDVPQALQLAQGELKNRQDAASYDALAWAQQQAGQSAEAWQNVQKALATGVQDARLFFHAATIAQANQQSAAARRYLKQARQRQQTLLPSERAQLATIKL